MRSSPTSRRTRTRRHVDALLSVAALRRADGGALARCRALRRHARLSHRQPPDHVAVARLGDCRLQPEHAVRRVHDRAARRRSAARRDKGSDDRVRLQPQSHDQFRRGSDRGGVPGRVRDRPRRGHVLGVHGADDGLRAVSFAQVRSHHAQGVLPVLRVLQLATRGRPRRSEGERGSRPAVAVRCAAGAARRADVGD